MEYMVIFFTHSGAIKYNRYLQELGIESNLMPVPRRLSSSCGIGARFIYDNSISKIINNDINKIYKVNSGDYQMIYENE